jgi:hypothetical protein
VRFGRFEWCEIAKELLRRLGKDSSRLGIFGNVLRKDLRTLGKEPSMLKMGPSILKSGRSIVEKVRRVLEKVLRVREKRSG